MRVLVTGAAGFLGSHIVSELLAFNHEVICLDSRPGTQVGIKQSWIAADITQDKLVELLKGHLKHLDAVIHLAAVASPLLANQDPATAFNVNVQGTHNLLKLAVEVGARRFCLASTAHVYGVSPPYLPSDERSPLSVFDTYTTTKLIGEQLCDLFWENYGLSYCSIRLFNGYGPGQPAGYYIADKIQQAMAGDFELRGHQVTKDWVFMNDVVQAYIRALHSAYVGPINVGTGIETDLETIANKIAKSFGVQLTIKEASSPPTRMCADWSRAKSVLGWEPKISLEEGLERTMNHWRQV